MRQSKDQGRSTKNQEPRTMFLLCSCSSRFFCAVGHVVTLSRVNIQLARLALSIFGLHPYLEAVQPPVVLLFFGQCKTETVASCKVTNDYRKPGAVVAHAIHAYSFATGTLGQLFRAAIQTNAHPTSDGLADGHKELEQRPQINSQGVKDDVVANEYLFSFIPVLEKDRSNSIRHPNDCCL